MSNAIKRFPILGESDYEILITGAESFTPDGRLIMNESAEVCSDIHQRKHSIEKIRFRWIIITWLRVLTDTVLLLQEESANTWQS